MEHKTGKREAVASLVMGIVSMECWFFGRGALISVVLGIIGIVMSSSAEKEGYHGGLSTAGFVLSLLGLIGGIIVVISFALLVGVASVYYEYIVELINEIGGSV